MEIREAGIGDEDLIAKDFWLPLGKEMEKYSELNILRDDAGEKAVEGFKQYLSGDSHRIFLLEENNEDLGFLIIEIGERSSRENSKYLSITDIFVKEDYRNEGYGTRLLEHAEEIAENNACDFLQVSAEWKNKKARKFYKDNGFKEKQVTYVEKVD